MSGLSNYPLSGYKVVDLASGIVGGYCTKVLADGGAEVIKVEAPEGDALRQWSASHTPVMHGDDGALFQFLACSKQSVMADPAVAEDLDRVRQLIGWADAVVWSPGSRLAAHPQLAPAAIHEWAPHATVVSITPFGLDGPWASRPATEFTLQAWSGGVSQRGVMERPPTAAGGRIGEWIGGMFGALGLLISRWRSARDGTGELVDVSMLEGLILTQTMYPVTFQQVAGYPFFRERRTNLPSIHPTKDGFVGFMVVTGQQWQDFCSMIGRTDWYEDESLLRFDRRSERRAELLPKINAWTGEQTTDQIVELASGFRIPVAHIGNGATVPQFDHLKERDFYLKNPRSGFLQPDVPYTFRGEAERRLPTASPALGEQTDQYRNLSAVREAPPGSSSVRSVPGLPFDGLRVADFTGFWAGSLVASVLAMYGADVIHVESMHRPDGLRFNSAREIGEENWWEWAGLFQGANTDKRDVAVDLRTERGREAIRRVLSHCDVVLENFSPRVMEGWGLGYDDLKALRSDVIMVRMPAFGLRGPWRDRVGYAQTMEQISGLAWMTGYPDGLPEVLNGSCDPIAGSHATIALLLALEHRRRTGEGMLVEVAMVGGALAVAAEQVIEYSANGQLLERCGNRSTHEAPQGLYLSGGVGPDGSSDEWVAISVATDEQWGHLQEAIGDPGLADETFATMAGRRVGHDRIDEGISAWCKNRSSDEIVGALWSVGVPVGKVMRGEHQTQIAQLQNRGFFEELTHPVTGAAAHSTYPARFSRAPAPVHRSPAPTLGQDNEAVLCGLAGYTAEEFEALVRAGIVGTRPGNAGTAW